MKKIKQLLSYNLKTVLSFELIYKLISVTIFTPLFLQLFKLIMQVTGFNYITSDNIFLFLSKPLTLLFLLILILLITFYTLIDISTIMVILDSSYQKQKITILDAFKKACQKAVRVFKRANIFLPFLVIFLIPFLNMGISSSFIGTIAIPEFVYDFIINNQVLVILYIILMFSLLFLLLRWLYVLPYFIIEDCNFKEARIKSKNLSTKNKIKDFLKIEISQIIIAVSYFLFIFLSILIIVGLYKILPTMVLKSLAITIIWIVIAISLVVLLLIATPLSYTIITILFFKHKEEKKEKIKHLTISSKEKVKTNKKMLILKYGLIVFGFLLASLFTYNVLQGKYDLNIEYLMTTEVTAHRGDSLNYPENTIAAFKGAVDKGADWIELDVQQTKDEVLVIAHDFKLGRTTGVNKYIYDVTYDEIKTLDAGSFFDPKFKGEKMPTLEEAILFAQKNNVKLNIELKPTGKEKDFEKGVVAVINKYNFESNCLITSQNYETLQKIKKLNKNIKTGYIMFLAYGDILEFKDVDGFSLEASLINNNLVKKIHNAGKEIYAWTINTEENINKMLDYQVDNIITDDVSLAQKIIYDRKTSNVISEYVKFVTQLFD